MLGRPRIGQRLSLMPRLPEHLPTIYAWYDHPDFQKRGPLVPYHTYLDWYAWWAKNKEWSIWSVVLSDTSRNFSGVPRPAGDRDLIGIASLSQVMRGRICRNGYLFIHPSYRRQGYGTDVVRLCTEYAFTMHDAEIVQAPIELDDEPMRRILERVGYSLGGRGAYYASREVDLYLVHRDAWDGPGAPYVVSDRSTRTNGSTIMKEKGERDARS